MTRVTRIDQLLELLRTKGRVKSSVVREHLGLTPKATSRVLSDAEKAGNIHVDRRGGWRNYTYGLNPPKRAASSVFDLAN